MTQKQYRVEILGRKPSRVHEYLAGTPRCALACPGARMVARGRSYRGRVSAMSWPGTGRIVGAGRRIVGVVSAVSWRVRTLLCALCCTSCSPGTLYCDTVAQPPSHFGHNTLCVLRYKRPAFKPALVTIHLSVLRYTLLATSPCWSQYNALYCDTALASQPLSHNTLPTKPAAIQCLYCTHLSSLCNTIASSSCNTIILYNTILTISFGQ